MKSKKLKNKSSKKKQVLSMIDSKKFDLNKFKVPNIISIEGTKKKIGNFYSNFKKRRELEKKRAEKNRKLETKREIQRQKKEAQRDKLNKLKEEKLKILAQQRLVIENEKQVKRNEERRQKVEAKRLKIEQQKIKDEEAKKLREDARNIKEEELRIKMLERQRIREEKIKIKEEAIKAKAIELQKIRELQERQIELQTKNNELCLQQCKDSSDDSSDEKIAIDNQISGALGQISIAVENYPNLQASSNFLHLQSTLNEVEAQLSASRRSFNSAVTDYNNKVEMFPSSIVASRMGLKERLWFEAPEIKKGDLNVGALFNN